MLSQKTHTNFYIYGIIRRIYYLTLVIKMTNEITIYAFNRPDDGVRKAVYEEIKKGKSRFGWSQEDYQNLTVDENKKIRENSKQLFLLRIKKGDWIVHVKCPEKEKCVAVQVAGGYGFDNGVPVEYDGKPKKDFRHYIPIDTSSFVEFNRHDAPSNVNLAPWGRWQTVYAQEDFLKFIEVLKGGGNPKDHNPFYEKTDRYLLEITRLISEYNRSKKLEKFLAEVFRQVPGVLHVKENGSQYGTDYGTDLLVDFSYLGQLGSPIKLVVQAKSYKGDHVDPHAIDQVKTGLDKYGAHFGLIITTADNAEVLENKLAEEEGNENIQILAGKDVARFVLSVAPNLVFNLKEQATS